MIKIACQQYVVYMQPENFPKFLCGLQSLKEATLRRGAKHISDTQTFQLMRELSEVAVDAGVIVKNRYESIETLLETGIGVKVAMTVVLK